MSKAILIIMTKTTFLVRVQKGE